ncbi:MAG: sigma-70 family RNA polymerase sigma factor [Chitinophagaceae bacterium]
MQNHKEDLAARFTKGEVAAFNEIFNEFHHRIYVFCKYFVPAEDAEDITAEIFTRLWKMQKELNTIQNIRAFLYISARNASFNRLRDLKTRAIKERELAEMMAKEDNLIILSEAESDVITRIKTEIDKLPENCKQVFTLSYFEGYKNPEIAEKLSINEKTVRNLKAMALKAIKAVFLNKNMQLTVFVLLVMNYR